MISMFIDTSLPDVSIALVKDGNVLSKVEKQTSGKHSEYVLKLIEDILNENKLSTKDVDEIIVVNGPGSFTGIRIGVTIAKVFAYIEKIRIVTMTSLLARVIGESSSYLLSKIDAKHDNYYVGLYDKDYNKVVEKFTNNVELEELINKYSPLLVDTSKPYNIKEIVEYTKKLPSENPHSVNPIYLKLPEAMEKK